MLNELRQVPGLVDLRIQQRFDYPKFDVAIDRTKAGQAGFTARDLANSLLISLSGSFQTTPTFFLNWQNGVTYNLATQTPQYRIQSLHDLENIPISSPDRASARHSGQRRVDHALERDGRALALRHPPGRGHLRRRAGQATSARWAATSRGSSTRTERTCPAAASSACAASSRPCGRRTSGCSPGLGFAIVLVYLLIVVNFQSWLDPFIIITALPAALAGIVVFLFLTGTTLSVPALMGAIMSIGVATANSILVVAFAKERLGEHADAATAAVEAGFTRFRPVLDDRAGHDHRHGADGAGARGRRRAECAARARRHRRSPVRHRRHPHLRAHGVRPAARAALVRSIHDDQRSHERTRDGVRERAAAGEHPRPRRRGASPPRGSQWWRVPSASASTAGIRARATGRRHPEAGHGRSGHPGRERRVADAGRADAGDPAPGHDPGLHGCRPFLRARAAT